MFYHFVELALKGLSRIKLYLLPFIFSVRKDVDDILSLIKTSNKQSLTKTSQQTAVHRQRTQSKTNTTESGEELFQKAKTASMK